MNERPTVMVNKDTELDDDQIQEFVRESEERYKQLQEELKNEDLDPDNLSTTMVMRVLDEETGETRELVYRLTLPVWLLADGNALAMFINTLLGEIQMMHLNVIVAMSDGGDEEVGEGGLAA